MKWKWDTDKIVGLSAMAVGVAEGQEPGVVLLRKLLPLFVIAEVPHTWLVQAKADSPASDKAVIFVTYSSVYGETWHLRSDSFVPVPGPAPGATPWSSC